MTNIINDYIYNNINIYSLRQILNLESMYMSPLELHAKFVHTCIYSFGGKKSTAIEKFSKGSMTHK